MIRQFLDLSTGHLTLQTRNWLASINFTRWNRRGEGGQTTQGWFLYAHDDPDAGNGDEFPPDLWACFQKARSEGCDYLLFDADADQLEGLPYYEED